MLNSRAFVRRESSESLFPQMKEQLLALRKPEKVNKQPIEIIMEQRKVELMEEHRLYDIQNSVIPNVNGFKSIITELKNANKKKQQILQHTQNLIILKRDIKQTTKEDLNKVLEQSEQEQDIFLGLEMKIEEINQSIRKTRQENQVIKDQLDLYDQHMLKFKEKQQTNITNMELAVKHQEIYQKQLENQSLLLKRQLSPSKHKQHDQRMKDTLMSLCQLEEQKKQLVNKLSESKVQINELDEQITTKFHKIEECAEFLEELDDFDKLVLMFVYDDPSQFELAEILQNIKLQLQQPKDRLMLASNEQEYIDRARFSQVSSRMKIFFKFHGNDLNEKVDKVIQVYNKMQVEYETLQLRHDDLLEQKTKNTEILLDLEVELRQFAKFKIPDDQEIDLDASEEEEEVKINLNIQIRHIEQSRYFFVRIFSTLTNVLARMINSLQNIKEVLKSCQSELFDEQFYFRWTQNNLFSKISQIASNLETQFKIKMTSRDPQVRVSNQLLNAIYDNFESKNTRRRTLPPEQISVIIQDTLPQLSQSEILNIESMLCQDILLQQFFTQRDLQNIVDKNLSFDQILDKIQTKGFDIAHNHLRQQVQYLFDIISGAIIDCRQQEGSESPRHLNRMKDTLHDILEKNMNLYEYKEQEWKKQVLDNRIKQFDTKQDLVEDILMSPRPIDIPQYEETIKSRPKIIQTTNGLRRYLNSLTVPTSKTSEAIKFLLDPVFTKLHHQTRNIKSTKQRLEDQIKIIANPMEASENKTIIPTKRVSKSQIIKLPKVTPIKTKLKVSKSQRLTTKQSENIKTEQTTNTSNYQSVYSVSNRNLVDYFKVK
ncbi:hypothetical protein pb186bvf_015885 [Paramecium bursaria]